VCIVLYLYCHSSLERLVGTPTHPHTHTWVRSHFVGSSKVREASPLLALYTALASSQGTCAQCGGGCLHSLEICIQFPRVVAIARQQRQITPNVQVGCRMWFFPSWHQTASQNTVWWSIPIGFCECTDQMQPLHSRRCGRCWSRMRRTMVSG
jgi:hypothetical protein